MNYLGLFIALGAVFGVVFGNIAIGISFGVVAGLLWFTMSNKKSTDDDN